LICPVIAVHGDLGLLDVLINFGSFGNSVFFLLLSQSIFDDRFRLRPAHGVLLALMEMLGFWRLAGLIYRPWNWGLDMTTASLLAQQFAAPRDSRTSLADGRRIAVRQPSAVGRIPSRPWNMPYSSPATSPHMRGGPLNFQKLEKIMIA